MNHRIPLNGLCGSRNGRNPNDVFGIWLNPKTHSQFHHDVRVMNITALASGLTLESHVDTYEFNSEDKAKNFINGWCVAMSIASISGQFFILNNEDDTVIDLFHDGQWDSERFGDDPNFKIGFSNDNPNNK